MPYETYQSETLAPGWLRDPWGSAYLGGLGKVKDALVARAKEAVKARFPLGDGGSWDVVITEGVNDKLDFIWGSTTTVATLRPGFYALETSLVTEVSRALSAAVSQTNWSVSVEGGRLRISFMVNWAPRGATGANVARGGWPTLGFGAVDYAVDTTNRLAPNAVVIDSRNAGPYDALVKIATERGIARGPTESEARFRQRVRAAWDSWRWAGTAYGLLTAFYWAGYTPTSGRVLLQTESERQYELRSDFDPAVHAPEEALVVTNIGPVSLGGTPELWSDFAVMFVSPLPPAWSPSPPVDGAPEVNGIRDIIRRWKPAHERCVKLQVSGGRLWGYPSDDLFNGYAGQTWAQVGGGVNATWTPPSG